MKTTGITVLLVLCLAGLNQAKNSSCLFLCLDGTCLNEESDRRCDGDPECPDSSDEMNCTCGSDRFLCKNGACLRMHWRCNGHDNCKDNSDEEDCEKYVSHHPHVITARPLPPKTPAGTSTSRLTQPTISKPTTVGVSNASTTVTAKPVTNMSSTAAVRGNITTSAVQPETTAEPTTIVVPGKITTSAVQPETTAEPTTIVVPDSETVAYATSGNKQTDENATLDYYCEIPDYTAKGHSSNKAMVAGIVTAALAGTAILIVLVVLILRKKQLSRKARGLQFYDLFCHRDNEDEVPLNTTELQLDGVSLPTADSSKRPDLSGCV